MSNNLPEKRSEILIYQTEDSRTRIEVRSEDETVWLSQAQLCELFDKNKRTISEHIRNIFKEGELQEEAVVRKYRTTYERLDHQTGRFSKGQRTGYPDPCRQDQP